MRRTALLPALAMMALPLCLQSCTHDHTLPPQVVQTMEHVADYNLYAGNGFTKTKIQQEYYLRFLFRYFVEHDMFPLALQYGHMLYDLRQTSTPVDKAGQKELEMLLLLCEIADGRNEPENVKRLEELAKEGVPFAEKSLVILQHHRHNTDSPLYARYLESEDEDLMFALQEESGNDGIHPYNKFLKLYIRGLIQHHYSMGEEGKPVYYPCDGRSDTDPAYYKSGPLQGEPLSL